MNSWGIQIKRETVIKLINTENKFIITNMSSHIIVIRIMKEIIWLDVKILIRKPD